MHKVLIIAYYFPPSGGPGVQRVLKHVKYLSDFGWQPVVLTVSNGNFPARDESLISQIPPDIKVFRTKILEPYGIYRTLTGKKKDQAIDVNVIKKESQEIGFKDKLAEFIRATLFIPDARIGWLFTAVREGIKIATNEKINAIYSSSPPYTCSLIARNIKRVTGLPWIAGFRDPWTEFLTTPKRWAWPAAFDRMLEHSVFREADFVESAWEGITKDALRKYPELSESKFVHVPNGFDSSDFPVINPVKNERFTLTYTGSMYGRRNPQALLTALDGLISSGKIDPNKLCIRFIGRFGTDVEEMMDSFPYPDIIEKIGYVQHEESLRYLLLSDCLLLVVDEAKESEEIVPGKVYEYVGTLKPILAIGPEPSAIADLLRETKCGNIAHQSNIDGISAIFLEYYQNWLSGSEDYHIDKHAVKRYERREAANSLAGLLDSLMRKNK